jgi:hypothetical protein
VGHRSGVISAYSPDSVQILNMVGLSKFHDGVNILIIKKAINRILIKDTLVNGAAVQFVMTCSSDGYLKIFKSDESFENIGNKYFDFVKLI